jgi:MFS family permease
MALGYHGMGGNLGVALTPIIVAALAGAVHWRLAFAVFGALALLVGTLIHFASGRQPQEATVPALARGEAPSSSPHATRTMVVAVVVIYGISVMMGFIYRGAITFLPLHLKENVQVSVLGADPVVVAGSFTTVALLFGVVGQYLGGYLGERLRREYAVVPMMAVVVPVLFLVGQASGLLLVVGAALFAFTYFISQPVLDAILADYVPPHLQGRAFGLLFLAGFGLASFAGSLAGYIAGRAGTAWVFLALIGFAATALLLTLYLLRIALRRGSQAT